jgi:hypothetical protein
MKGCRLILLESSIMLIIVPIVTSLVISGTRSQVASAQSQNIGCTNNIQHWDKIIFFIRSPDLAQKANLPMNTELDIKVLDDPTKVSDIRLKVLTFLNQPNAPRDSIQILYVRYAATICG